MMDSLPNIAIIGSGIAGLSTCHWLLEANIQANIHLFYDEDVFMASNGPTLLFHPFPGRSLNPPPFLPNAVEHTLRLLKSWQELAPKSIRSTPIFRPLTSTNGERLRKSFEKWWISPTKDIENTAFFEYYTSEQLQKQESIYQIDNDALKIQPSYSIDGADIIKTILEYFAKKGVQLHCETIRNIQNTQRHSHLNQQETPFDKVVLTLGRKTPDWFPHLQVSLQGGALLQSNLPSITHNLSMDGMHLGQHANGKWVIGATRWEHPPTPESQIPILLQQLQQVLPHLPIRHECHSAKDVWMGMRCIYSVDRLPLMGKLPQYSNIFVLTALGSKGWLWGPYAAKLLSNLLQNQRIPQKEYALFDLMRANAEDGWYSPKIHFA